MRSPGTQDLRHAPSGEEARPRRLHSRAGVLFHATGACLVRHVLACCDPSPGCCTAAIPPCRVAQRPPALRARPAHVCLAPGPEKRLDPAWRDGTPALQRRRVRHAERPDCRRAQAIAIISVQGLPRSWMQPRAILRQDLAADSRPSRLPSVLSSVASPRTSFTSLAQTRMDFSVVGPCGKQKPRKEHASTSAIC